jgi:colanic acid/amylovoran biosynthesis protein
VSPPRSEPRPEPRNVLLLDFWSEKNRGDAAMQVGLVRLVRKRLPAAHLTVMAASGSNQWPGLMHELDETTPLVDEVVGGLRPWLLGPFDSGPLRTALVRKLASGCCAVVSVSMIPLWPILARTRRLDFMLPRSTRRSVRALRSADLVLWNCRNIRGESAIGETYEVWRRLYNATAAIQSGKPVACIGASIWPLRNPLSRAMARGLLQRTSFISVRDHSSYEYARALLRGKTVRLRLLPDLSLSLLADSGPLDRQLPQHPRRLGLTIVDRPTLGEEARKCYVAALRGWLESFLQREGTEIDLIPQVTNRWQSTVTLEDDLLRDIDQARVHRVPGQPTVDELMALYGGVDILVGTRMHSAIFALCQGTPAVTIPYVTGGKWGILDMMGAHDIDVPCVGITAESLTNKVESVWQRRSELLASVRETLPALATSVEDNVAIAVELYMQPREEPPAVAPVGRGVA